MPLTRMLAGDLRRDRILVNAVRPGWVATDMGGPGGRPVPRARPVSCGLSTCPTTGPPAGSTATATRSPGNAGQHHSAAHRRDAHGSLMTVGQVGWMPLGSIALNQRWTRRLPCLVSTRRRMDVHPRQAWGREAWE
jgi:hypothetical protein